MMVHAWVTCLLYPNPLQPLNLHKSLEECNKVLIHPDSLYLTAVSVFSGNEVKSASQSACQGSRPALCDKATFSGTERVQVSQPCTSCTDSKQLSAEGIILGISAGFTTHAYSIFIRNPKQVCTYTIKDQQLMYAVA